MRPDQDEPLLRSAGAHAAAVAKEPAVGHRGAGFLDDLAAQRVGPVLAVLGSAAGQGAQLVLDRRPGRLPGTEAAAPRRVPKDLDEAAGSIRRRSRQLRDERGQAKVPYVDVGAVGFEAAMIDARRHLLGRD